MYGNLNPEEIFLAECIIFRIMQKKILVNEQANKLKTLGAFKDKNDVIRLKRKILYRPDVNISKRF